MTHKLTLTNQQLSDFKNCEYCNDCSMPDAPNNESWNETVIKCIRKVSEHFNIK